MADFKKTIKFSLDGVEQSINNVAELSKFLKQAKDNVDTLDDTQLAGLRDGLNEIGNQLDEVGNKNKNLTEAFQDFTTTVNTKIPVNSIKNFKVQLQGLEEQLESLEVGSDSFKKVKMEADNLKIALEKVEQTASDSRQQFVDLGKGVAESLVSSIGTFKAFTSGQEEADRVLQKFGETLALVEAVEKAAIAVKEIDKFITQQAALATLASTTATAANTVATTTNTVATEGAAVAQSGLTAAYNASAATLKKLYIVMLANPYLAIAAAVTAVAVAVYTYGENAREALDKIKASQEEELSLFEKLFEKRKALLALRREQDANDRANKDKFSKNDITREQQRFKDEIESLKFFLEQKALVEAKIQEREDSINTKRIAGKNLNEAEKNKERQEIQKLRLDADIRFANAEIELKNLLRDQDEFDLDVARKTAALQEDIDIEKLNAKKTFTNQFVLNDKLEKKELADLLLEYNKGEIKSLAEYLNSKQLLTEKYNNIELDLKKQLTDKLTEFDRKKEDSDLDRTLKSSQIKTRNIQDDQDRQVAALKKQRDIQDARALEDRDNALKEVGDLTTDAGKKLAAAIERDYKEQLKNNKDNQNEQLLVVKDGIDAREIANTLAQRELLNIENSGNQDIVDNIKESYDERIKANDILLERQIETIEELRDIALLDKTLTDDEIKLVNEKANAEIVAAEKIIKAQNKIFEGRKKLFKTEEDFNTFVGALENIESTLTNIAALGLDITANSIISSIGAIGGALSTLTKSLDTISSTDYSKLPDGQKLADQVKAYGQAAAAIVDITNKAIQAVVDAQLVSLDAKLVKIQELKDKIDEDLDKTRDDIRELQSNLAEAQLEDRERLIKKIAKQREAEKKLADQKQKAIQDEINLQEKQKELKKKAFIANKIASILQVGINTAIGVSAALINPVTAPITIPLISIIGAVQAGLIAATPVPEFKKGGFTSKGSSDEVAGIVHKNEYVIPAWQVESPRFSSTIAELEQSRLAGFAGGGFVTQQNNNSDFLQAVSQQNQLIAKIVERPTVVSVQEIQSVGAKVNKTRVKATL